VLKGEIREAEEALEFVLGDEEEVRDVLNTMTNQISLLQAQSRASVGSTYDVSDDLRGLEDYLEEDHAIDGEEVPIDTFINNFISYSWFVSQHNGSRDQKE